MADSPPPPPPSNEPPVVPPNLMLQPSHTSSTVSPSISPRLLNVEKKSLSYNVVIVSEDGSTEFDYKLDNSSSLAEHMQQICAKIDPSLEPADHALLIMNMFKYVHAAQFEIGESQRMAPSQKLRVVDQVADAVRTVQLLTESLHGNSSADGKHEVSSLKKLVFTLDDHLKVAVFAEEFISQGGMEALLSVIQGTEGSTAAYALKALSVAVEYFNGVEYVKNTPGLLGRLFELIGNKNITVAREATALVFVMAHMFEDGFELVHESAKNVARIRNALPYEDIVTLLKFDDINGKINALTFINVLLSKAPNTRKRQHLLKRLDDVDVLGVVNTAQDIASEDYKTQLHIFKNMVGDFVPPASIEIADYRYKCKVQDIRLRQQAEDLVEYQKHQQLVKIMRDELQRYQRAVAEAHQHGVWIRAYSPENRFVSDVKRDERHLIALDDLLTADSKSDNVQQQIGKLQQERDHAIAQYQAIQVQNAELIVERDALKANAEAKASSSAQVDQLKHDLTVATNECNMHKQQVATVESELNSIKLRLSDAEHELKQTKDAYEKTAAAGSAEPQVITKVETKTVTDPALVSENKSLKEQIEKLQADLKTAKEQSTSAVVISAPPAPSIPAAPGVAPPAPSIPGAPPAPSIPGAPPAPSIPGAPPAPSIPGAPPAPSIPGAPPAPSIPGAPPAAPGIPGAPPAAPGAPGAPAAPTVVRQPTKPDVKPKQRMRALHWSRILLPSGPAAPNVSTVWKKIGDRKLDYDEVEAEFAQKAIHRRQASDRKSATNAEELAIATLATKKKTERALDDKRSNAVAIMLSQLPKLPSIKSAIATLNDSILRRDQIDNIRSNMPTSDEIAKIKEVVESYGANKSNIPWDLPERFFMMINEIPKCNVRLNVWSYMLHWSEVSGSAHSKVKNITVACKELLASSSLRTVLGIVLYVGNYLNGGNARRGRADGFDIDILVKLDGTKNNTNTMNLLQFVARLASRDGVTSAKLQSELKTTMSLAQAEDLGSVENEVKGLQNKYRSQEAARKVVVANPIGTSDSFETQTTRFFKQAKTELGEVIDDLKVAQEEYQDLLEYFGDGSHADSVSKKRSTAEIFGIFANFVGKMKNAIAKEGPAASSSGSGRAAGKTFGKKVKLNAMMNELRKGITMRALQKK
jgi:Formin Homology 2 Domain/ELMO, armadillo-like helical domain